MTFGGFLKEDKLYVQGTECNLQYKIILSFPKWPCRKVMGANFYFQLDGIERYLRDS